MNNGNVFKISAADIKRLDENKSVSFFKSLLEAEVFRYALPRTRLQITDNTKESDGGIDATVDFGSSSLINDLLKNGDCCYQIKADNSFTSLSKGAILKELYGEGKVEELENLTPELAKNKIKKKTLETVQQGKYYVLVAFQAESAGTKKQDAINLIVSNLKKCGVECPNVDIIDSTNLAILANYYPAIVNQLNPTPDNIFSVEDMLNRPTLSHKHFKRPDLQDIETNIKDFLDNVNEIRHIRVLADAGIGKTKTVLELCKDYSNIVLYFVSADEFEDSTFYSFLKKNRDLFVVLIIDECNNAKALSIWDRLSGLSGNIRLISISNDLKRDDTDSTISVIDLPRMSDELFTQILTELYGMDKPNASHIASFCEGYPRLAHYIGKNYQAQKQVLYRLEDVLTGVVMGSNPNEELTRKTMCILRYFSIFKKFGFSNEFKDEKIFIYNLIKFEEPSLTEIELDRIVRTLKTKKILQQEHTLYISPKILHIWLYGQFWSIPARKEQILSNIDNFPKSLQKWFGEMFEYARNAQLSVDIPKELLERFNYDDFLDKGRSDFFFNLTKANPKEALKTLDRIFKDLSNEQIKNIAKERMTFIWALQYILFDGELFACAIKILFKLAENENETLYSNNATGIFRQMFHARLPGTEASLESRAKLLTDLYNNVKTKNGLILLLKTFDSALKTDHFTRMGGVENQGFEVKTDYCPKTYDEFFDYWSCIFGLLIDCIDNQTDKEIINFATQAIYHNDVAHLKYCETTQNKIFEIFDLLKQSKNIDKTELWLEILKTIQFLNYSKDNPLTKKAIAYLEALKDVLKENKPKETTESFFNVDIWAIVDDRKDAYEDFLSKISKSFEDLCVNLNEQEKKDFIKELIITKYKNEYYFGVMIARNDTKYELLDDAIDFYRDSEYRDSMFLVGYFAEIYKTSNKLYDEVVKKLYDLQLFDLVVNINSSAIPTEVTSELAFNSIRIGKVPSEKINTFIWIAEKVQLSVIKNILEFAISKCTSETITSAINVLYHNKEIWTPENYNLIFRVLDSAVQIKDNKAVLLIDDDYIWSSVLEKFVGLQGDSDDVFILFEKLIIYMTQREANDFGFSEYIKSLLSKFTEINPRRAWNYISKHLKRELIVFSPIKDWLGGDDHFDHDTQGAMSKFSIDDIFDWIDADKKTRLEIIAYCAPKDLFKWDSDIMRSLLVKYGNNEQLKRYLSINLGNKGWVGKASDNIKREISEAESVRKTETDLNVIDFIDNQIEKLNADLKRELISEERSDY